MVRYGRSKEAKMKAPMGAYAAERARNPFLRSSAGGRVLSALMLPWFAVRPPAGFGVLTTTGRKTGKRRRKCIRAVRVGNRAYIVSIRPSAWLRNVGADPSVRLRVRGGTFAGVARALDETAETRAAVAAYCETVNPFDYVECTMWRRGRPTRAKVRALHRAWFDQGTPLLIELKREAMNNPEAP
jgi:deazaflavin-dependent oxidoreductase (nitroreductase family)